MATFYPVKFIQSKNTNDLPHIKVREFLYRFKTESNHVYFIQVEEFVNKLFAVKFYAKDHRLSRNKYKLLTNKNNIKEARSIILTCIHVGFILLNDFPKHSFAFIGCPKYGSDETYYDNQRFRVYNRFVTTFIDAKKFRCYTDPKYSTCLLINEKSIDENKELFNMYQKMYNDHIVSFLE